MLYNERKLVYYNPNKQLYVKLDILADGFRVIVFYLKDSYTINKSDLVKLLSTAIKPILFISKILGPIEKRYWPIEIEVVCLV